MLEWSAHDVNRLIRVALEIAEAKPTTKLGVTMIRDLPRLYRKSTAEPTATLARLSVRMPPSTR